MNFDSNKVVSSLVEMKNNDAASFVRVLSAEEVQAVVGCGSAAKSSLDLAA